MRERGYLNSKPPENFLYRYELESFGLRRKEFWPLDKSNTLLKDFIPKLTHESDGLILQVRILGGMGAGNVEKTLWEKGTRDGGPLL